MARRRWVGSRAGPGGRRVVRRVGRGHADEALEEDAE